MTPLNDLKMTNTLGIPLYNLKMLSEKMYKCMTVEASRVTWLARGTWIQTNANVQEATLAERRQHD